MELSCVDCAGGGCHKDSFFPDFCLTTHLSEEVLKEAMAEYEKPFIKKSNQAAAEVETDFYGQIPRVLEIVEYAKKMGFKKLGIITCVGLIAEARVVAKIFRSHGFDVYGAGCKVGMQKKVDIGIPKYCEATGEMMCNPILQAKLMNEAKTDLNVVIGLCVGHDSMVYKYSDALVTTLIAKDRLLGHNPVQAIYQADKYYKNKLFGDCEVK